MGDAGAGDAGARAADVGDADAGDVSMENLCLARVTSVVAMDAAA